MTTGELEDDVIRFHKALKKQSPDYEEMHYWLDNLMIEALVETAKNNKDAPQMARKVLKLNSTNFKKWYS